MTLDLKLKRRSAHDLAVESLGRRIVSGEYPAGALLPPSDDLARQLGLSRPTLREALQTLAAKGLVVARAKVGTRVRDQSAWNMFDADILGWRQATGLAEASLAALYEIRQSLEPAAAAFAAERRSEEDVARLQALGEKLRLDSGAVADFVAADVAFHRLVLDMSANPFMRSIGALIGSALSASFTLSAPTEGEAESAEVQRQHLDVVEAIRCRDPQRASDAMTKVIAKGWVRYSGSALRKLADAPIATFP